MRVRLQRLDAAHALIGIEHLAVLQLAGDGGVVAGDRVDVLDRRVGAVADDGARFHQLLPDVGAFLGALRAEAQPDTYGASDVQWTPCIAAITPSWPKRGMSAAFRCCACSTRQRRSLPSRCSLNVSSKMFEHFAVGAVADRVDAQLIAVLDARASARLADVGDRSSCSGRCSPGLSAYGSSSHAPREPSAPSIGVLDRAHRQHVVAVADVRYCARFAASASLLIAQHHPQPDVILPSSIICFTRSTSAKLEPASWNDVMPFDSTPRRRQLEDATRARGGFGGRRSRLAGAGANQPRGAFRAAARSACRSRPSESRRRRDSACRCRRRPTAASPSRWRSSRGRSRA